MKPLTWSLATQKERSFYFCAVFGFLGLFEGFLAAGVLGLGGLLLAGRGFAFAGVISGLWGLAAFGPRDGASPSLAGNGAAARRAWRTAALACILASAVPLLAATNRPFLLASLFAAAGLGAALGRRARKELYAAAGKFGEGPLGPPLHLAMAGAGTVAGALLLGAVLRLRRGADDAAALEAAFSFLWFPALLSALGTFLARRIEKKGLDAAPRSGEAPAYSPPRRPLKDASSFLFGLGLMNPMLIESVIQNGKRIPPWGTAFAFAAAALASILAARLAEKKFGESGLAEALPRFLAAGVPFALYRGEVPAGLFALLLWGAAWGLGAAGLTRSDRDSLLPSINRGLSFFLGGSCIGILLDISPEAAGLFVLSAEAASILLLALSARGRKE